ncbi:hypothetical protein G195_001880 [Phytophthora kernoviae 00238/432]|uniref:Uncharacterized protein n=1 Tax=Phytophthora kernoviae 00238/432 TaxID=1284355 RepID=A0A8J4SQZ8_9STRA|nr:hypothetical protein G195_001880 [Phytophthora kernoviae 00238/432]
MYVLENDSANPLEGEWVEKGQIRTRWETFALDATTFEHKGIRYLVWAQKDPDIVGNSNLYISEMENPWTLRGEQVMIATPEYDWEIIGFKVNEGAAVLHRNGRIFVGYSASATDYNYCMGLLTADEDADLLDPASWVKSPKPVFQTRPYMDSRETLDRELEQILKWEKGQKDLFIWDKIGRLPFAMLDKVMPKALKQKIGDSLNEVGQYVQNGGRFLVQKKKVAKLLQEEAAKSGYAIKDEHEHMEQDVDAEDTAKIHSVEGLPLEVLDRTADRITDSRTKFAAAQGAATGIGGIVTIAADIPIVMGLSLKVLQEMALCYGYDPDEPQERIFIVKCLQFSSADIVGKKAIIDELSDYDNPDKQVEVISQMQGWREVFNSYSESFGWKKLFQLIPIAGMVFGSVSNKNTIRDVAEAGKMLYKKRLILQRLSQ